FPGLHPGQPHRGLGHGEEQDLVEVGGALAAEAIGGLRPRAVVLEAGQLDVAIRPVLDEAEGAVADELLELALARGLDALLGVDRGARPPWPREHESRP